MEKGDHNVLSKTMYTQRILIIAILMRKNKDEK